MAVRTRITNVRLRWIVAVHKIYLKCLLWVVLGNTHWIVRMSAIKSEAACQHLLFYAL